MLVSRAELSVEEGNATGTSYTVKLSSEPTAAVTVEIGGHSGTDLRLSGVSTSSTLTFTASNWDTAQTVTVRANEDADAPDVTATLTHTASGGDYAGVTRDLPVRVDDDETSSIVLSESSLEPVENATGTTYTVHLSHVPTVTVTVERRRSDRHRPDPVRPERRQHTHLQLLQLEQSPDGHGNRRPRRRRGERRGDADPHRLGRRLRGASQLGPAGHHRRRRGDRVARALRRVPRAGRRGHWT